MPKAFLIKKFLVMDLETYNLNGKLIPYAVSIYNGHKYHFFYLTDYENSTQMLIAAIKTLMLRRYHGYKVYLHNFSNFDGIFLINILNELSENISIKRHNDKFIEIKFLFNAGKYKLYFRDSLLMLPVSLRKLALQFNVGGKGIFPYDFVNSNNLDYTGPVPDIKYFSDISEIEYMIYCDDFKYVAWDLRRETEKYCVQDCVTLYQVLDKFFNENFSVTRVNASKDPSLSSLALANYNFY
uniref:DNA polymerase n=1 Tax=Dichomitus squalens TaxID=114155 RepID=UPI003001AD75|nr:DNA polymerase [Dichomitus squalens]